MGWNNQDVFSLIILTPTGGFTGLFAYNPAPGTNNLDESIAVQAGTDPYGNQYLAGFTSYSGTALPNAAVSLQSGGINFYETTGSGETGYVIQNAIFQSGGLGVLSSDILDISSNTGFAFSDNPAGGGVTVGYAIIVPSGDTTGLTDVQRIGNALTLFGTVILVPGTYFLASQLVIPDQCSLLGPWNPSWGIPTGNYGSAGLPLQGAILQPVAAFGDPSVIGLGSAGAGQHGGQRLESITIDGTLISGANTIDGILSTDFVGAVKMTDVVVYGGKTGIGGMQGNGLHVRNTVGGRIADFWQVTRCKFSDVTGHGVLLGASTPDTWFTDCESTGNGGDGWNVVNCNETKWMHCRGDSNTGNGLTYNGAAGFTGKVIFDSCTFNSNTGRGVSIAGTGTGTVVMTSTAADGNTAGQFLYAGTMNWKTDAAYNVSTVAPTFA